MATALSKSMTELPPSWMRAIRSSAPTTSAPACMQWLLTTRYAKLLVLIGRHCCTLQAWQERQHPALPPRIAHLLPAPVLRYCPLQTRRLAQACRCHVAALLCRALRGRLAVDRCPAPAVFLLSHQTWPALSTAQHSKAYSKHAKALGVASTTFAAAVREEAVPSCAAGHAGTIRSSDLHKPQRILQRARWRPVLLAS